MAELSHSGPFPQVQLRLLVRRLAAPRWLLTLALVVVLVWFVVTPFAFMAWSSLKPTGLPFDPGLTLANYRAVYLEARTYALLATTLGFVGGSTVLALAIGVPLAWLIERTDVPFRRTFRALVILPMATPPVLMAIAWVMLLSPRTGLFNSIVGGVLGSGQAPFDAFTFSGMIFVQALTVTPSTFLILSPAFRNMDPSLEEAALASGAGTWLTMRRVVMPILRPSILAAGVFLVIIGFVVFDVPGTLGLPVRKLVLATEIYRLATEGSGGLPDYGRISALSALFLVVLVGLALGYQRLTVQSQRFVTITGKNYRSRAFPLRRWRWPAACFIAGYFVLAVAAPLGILTWTSLLPYATGVSLDMLPQLTVANHLEFLGNSSVLEAARNSLVTALVAATAVAFLAVLISWAVVRVKAPGRRTLDVLSFLPMALPGVMLGVALIYVYLTVTVVPIYGSIWILVVAYTTTYLSFGTRVTNGVMHQLSADLEEAAATSGAGWGRTFRRVTLPLMLPALAAVWVWVVAHAMRELSAALVLHGRNNTVLSTLLWDYWSSGRQVTAAAVGVWLIAALLLLVGGWQVVTGRSRLEG